MKSGFEGHFEMEYDEIPFYRKRWFVVLLLLVFVPAMIVICFTGDVYALRKDRVYKYESPKGLGAVGMDFLAFGLFRGFF